MSTVHVHPDRPTAATRTRALVVEDSLTVRRRLVEVLAADPELEVVGEAADAEAAIDLCGRLRPDVVTLDMVLRGSSGLAVTEHVMAYCPTPILVVSSSTNRGELFSTLDALSAGAVDVLDKAGGDGWEARFVAAVKRTARIRVITHVRGRLSPRPTPHRPGHPPGLGLSPGRARVVALGVSTGGPAALIEILGALPADFPLPILLVIHIGAIFGRTFVEWLAGLSPLPVAEARDGQPLPPPGAPGVIMAPPDRHLAVRAGRLVVTDGPERHSCRPSVDTLLESLAQDVGPGVVAGILTGMGRDGAAGLLAVRRAGGATFAQDEASSVVFGMPREAILLGAAERVLALDQVGPALAALAPGRQEQRR